MARADPQINIRQPPERYLVLEAAAFVHGKSSVGKLVQELIEDAATRFAREPSVQSAIRIRAEQLAIDSGTLTRLPGGADARRVRAKDGTD